MCVTLSHIYSLMTKFYCVEWYFQKAFNHAILATHGCDDIIMSDFHRTWYICAQKLSQEGVQNDQDCGKMCVKFSEVNVCEIALDVVVRVYTQNDELTYHSKRGSARGNLSCNFEVGKIWCSGISQGNVREALSQDWIELASPWLTLNPSLPPAAVLLRQL